MRHPDVTIVDEGYQVGIVRTHGGIQSGSGGFSLQTYILVLHSRISDSSLPVFHKETAAPCVQRRDLSRRRVTRRRGRWYDPRLGPDHSWWCPNWHISYAPTAVVLLCCEYVLFRNVKYFLRLSLFTWRGLWWTPGTQPQWEDTIEDYCGFVRRMEEGLCKRG